MIYITNAFSLNMIGTFPALPLIREVSLEEVRDAVVFGTLDGGDYHAVTLSHGVKPAIGHLDTAALVDAQLGIGSNDAVTREAHPPAAAAWHGASTYKRDTVSLNVGDVVYVAQYRGPRLPEGTTTLPDGASIVWYRVDVLDITVMSEATK